MDVSLRCGSSDFRLSHTSNKASQGPTAGRDNALNHARDGKGIHLRRHALDVCRACGIGDAVYDGLSSSRHCRPGKTEGAMWWTAFKDIAQALFWVAAVFGALFTIHKHYDEKREQRRWIKRGMRRN
jgi:hypothetical protein